MISLDRPAAVIGDIHGQAGALAELLEALGDMPIFVVGDVGDRGPDTRGVIDLLIAAGARGVIGNHDLWLRDWSAGRGFDVFALDRHMGGWATLDSYGVHETTPSLISKAYEAVPPSHMAFLASLPRTLDLDVMGHSYVLIHAGMPDDPGLQQVPVHQRVAYVLDNSPSDLIWMSNDPSRMPDVGRTIVMGHRRFPRAIVDGPVIALDTGCGTNAGAPLTAVVLPERRVVQACP
jgi:serine/threonine protein phosphatase 1